MEVSANMTLKTCKKWRTGFPVSIGTMVSGILIIRVLTLWLLLNLLGLLTKHKSVIRFAFSRTKFHPVQFRLRSVIRHLMILRIITCQQTITFLETMVSTLASIIMLLKIRKSHCQRVTSRWDMPLWTTCPHQACTIHPKTMHKPMAKTIVLNVCKPIFKPILTIWPMAASKKETWMLLNLAHPLPKKVIMATKLPPWSMI